MLAVLVGLSGWYYLRPTGSTGAGPTVISGPIMGTTYTVKIAGALGASDRDAAAKAVKAALDDVNAKMSTYVDTSEVSRFASAPANQPFPLSEDTTLVIAKALAISRASGGAFDVTVRPLVDAWGFGPDGRPKRRPGAEDTEELLQRVGFAKLRLDEDKRALSKLVDGVSVDLSAIAKGYAVDQVAVALEGLGHDSYLVEVGGEMRGRGERKPGARWRVGIESPTDGPREVLRVVELPQHGLATSGNYRNFYIEDGVKYAHTLNPKTGQPVRHRLQSVSVIDEEAALADGWATALMVLGETEAIRVARANNLAALFMISEPEGGLRLEMTERFRTFIVQNRGTP